MSNKAQVLFTFEMKSHTETPRHGGGRCYGSCRG